MEVPNRPPDRVTFSEWEPIYGPERTRQVATDRTIFKVMEYTQVVDRPIVDWRRRRTEFWDVPQPMIVAGVGTDTLTFRQPPKPVETIGRWEWEYESAVSAAPRLGIASQVR